MLPEKTWRFRIRILLMFLFCAALSFEVRTCAYNREAANLAILIRDARPLWHGTFSRSRPASAGWGDLIPSPRPNFVPYTVESAMMYAYAEDVAFGRGVPERDARLAYLPEVPPYAQMNMTLEWVLGWGYRFLSLFRAPPGPEEATPYQNHPDFAWFVSVNVRLWTSLLSGLIFLWLVVMRVPPKLALAGGILHAVSAAAVARATGQDIVRGDFCIPLIVFVMVLAHSLYLRPGRFRMILLFLAAGAAFAAWDLCQMIFGIWILYEILRYLSGGRFHKRRRSVWIVLASAILLNALIVPFNVTYGLIMSVLVCVQLPLLFFVMHLPSMKFPKRFAAAAVAAACLFCFHHFAVDNPEYRANYSHFSNVMKSKLKYLNVKPADPSKLDYDSRIMWTPSMHSCTWEIASMYFPSPGSFPEFRMNSGMIALRNIWNRGPLTLGWFFLLLLAGGLSTPIRRAILRDKPRNLFPYLCTAGFTVGFAFIVRYHEFLIIFLSVSLPLLMQEWFHGMRPGGRKRAFLTGVLCFLLLFEFLITTSARTREYSTVDSYLPQTAQLVRWFRQGDFMRGKTVAASFTLSPVLMAYAGTSLIMQPQFGMEPIRRPVEEYLRIMYHGTVGELEDFCERYGTDYLVYDRGMDGPLHIYSSRYIANAEKIESNSPVNIMSRLPHSMRRFVPVPPPAALRGLSMKYTVFQFVKNSDMKFAESCAVRAGRLIAADDLEAAEKIVLRGLARDPGSEKLGKLHEMLFLRGYRPALRKKEDGPGK